MASPFGFAEFTLSHNRFQVSEYCNVTLYLLLVALNGKRTVALPLDPSIFSHSHYECLFHRYTRIQIKRIFQDSFCVCLR